MSIATKNTPTEGTAQGQELPSCKACGAELAARFQSVLDPQTRERFEIAACGRCGLGHTNPQPANLDPYYGPAYYGDRHGFTDRYSIRRRLRLVRSVAGAANGARLLDVGCGNGSFLLAARDAGWAVSGTEMNPGPGREAGLTVWEDLDGAASAGPFTCITLWHSLEHMRDPRATIAQCTELLEPGGTLVVAVPDARGFQARAFGPGWFHLDVPRHLFHFSGPALTELIESNGLEVIRRRHVEIENDVFGWVQSALNRLLPTPNVLFSSLTGRDSGAGRLQVGASYALGSILSLLAAPLTLASALVSRGAVLVFAARKEGDQ